MVVSISLAQVNCLLIIKIILTYIICRNIIPKKICNIIIIYLKYVFDYFIQGRDEVYESSWFAFKSLAFIMDKDNPRPTLNTVSKN